MGGVVRGQSRGTLVDRTHFPGHIDLPSLSPIQLQGLKVAAKPTDQLPVVYRKGTDRELFFSNGLKLSDKTKFFFVCFLNYMQNKKEQQITCFVNCDSVLIY